MLKVCDMQQFIERSGSLDEIICYGAGNRMREFTKLFQGTAVLNKCTCVVDRDVEKHGTWLDADILKIPVVSLEHLKGKRNVSCAIIITCADFTEILTCFENDEVLKEMDYYCLTYFFMFENEKKSFSKKIPSDFRKYENPKIPKVIHYFWFGKKPLPDRYKRWMESWHRFCPDYEIKEWNESNYDISKNVYMYQAYKSKMWGFVPDYARLDILYQYGGIYLDTDIEIIKTLDDLLYQEGFVGFECDTRINCGCGCGAVKGLDIIKEMRDDYDDRVFIKKDGSLDLTPSPNIQTEYLKKKGLKTNGEYQVINGLTVYPEKVLSGKNLTTRKIDIMSYTKAIHHFDHSWIDDNIMTGVRRIEKGILLAEQDIARAGKNLEVMDK